MGNRHYSNAIKQVAAEMGMSASFVEKVYLGYWRTIHEYMSSLPLKEELTDEEFLKLRPNINIPSIGKFYITLEDYHKAKRKYKIIKDYVKDKEN